MVEVIREYQWIHNPLEKVRTKPMENVCVCICSGVNIEEWLSLKKDYDL